MYKRQSIYIGGYEIPRKFIEDRKQRSLTEDEMETLSTIKAAIAGTFELQEEIDVMIRESELCPLALANEFNA